MPILRLLVMASLFWMSPNAAHSGDESRTPSGIFSYAKALDCKTVQLIEVSVFPLFVCEVKDTWPEGKVRKRCWVTPDQAAEMLDEPGLVAIFDELDKV